MRPGKATTVEQPKPALRASGSRQSWQRTHHEATARAALVHGRWRVDVPAFRDSLLECFDDVDVCHNSGTDTHEYTICVCYYVVYVLLSCVK